MEEMLKDDFMEALTEHYDYSEHDAERLWNENGAAYCSDIYDHMSDLIMEIVNG